MIFFITGGARSGKSKFAQKTAKELSANPVYIATARRWDEDFEKRIIRHRQDRGAEWSSYEEEKYVSKLALAGKVAVIDCVTLWLTNFFIDHKQDVDHALAEFKNEIDQLDKIDSTLIIVSNELGMGVHAETDSGRKFVDLQGWANQYVAAKAEKVYFMVSGISLKIKPN
jgi:adenosylcobinamide kinase/adenosylcobinamide-phosphate guanylyltransferase